MRMTTLFGLFLTASFALAGEADFGLTGIGALQTARLAALCSEDSLTSCDVTFEFHDINGRILKQDRMQLVPGSGGTSDLPSLPGLFASRLEIDPCIKVERGLAVASLQIMDNLTGRTNVFVNWADGSVSKLRDLDFGVTGITALDTARLSAYCEADETRSAESCDVTLEFHDLQGRTVKQSRVTLQSGTGIFVDLKLAETRTSARRFEIDPCVKVGRGTAIGSFELIDTFTGRSTVLARAGIALAAALP